MKHTKTLVIALFSVLLGHAKEAEAAVSANGYSCTPWDYDDASDFEYDLGIVNTSGGTRLVVCSLSADHGMGTLAQFDVTVSDVSSSAGFDCLGGVYSQTGDLLDLTDPMTTGTSQTGLHTLTATIAIASNASYSYAVSCNVPSGSSLRAIRVY